MVNGIGFYFFMFPMEMYYGASTVVYLYALGAVGAYVATKLKFMRGWMPSHLGASGALYSMMAYYILMNPKSTIYLYFFIPLPAMALAGIILFFELFVGS